jgi:arginase
MPGAPPLRLIAWPFHEGRPDVGMGLGSRQLATDDELHADLERQGWRPSVEFVDAVDDELPEIGRVFELDRRLAARVRAAVADGAFPVVLAGNCNSCLGTVAGLQPAPLGVVWFDAHADFDTTDDNESGFVDVMGLATLTGSAWRALRESIPGFSVVQEGRVVLGAVRDLEPYQVERLNQSDVKVVPGRFSPAELEAALDELRGQVEEVYLHLDLDALDAGEGRANRYAAEGGPSAGTLLRAVDEVFERFSVRAAALTAYDPAFDPDGRAKRAARALLARVAGGAWRALARTESR